MKPQAISKFVPEYWWHLGLIGLVVLVCFHNIFSNTLVWDDWDWIDWQLLKNFPSSLPSLLSGALYAEMITNYRPVKSLLQGFNYFLWQDNLFAYHAQAIMIHFLASSLVYLIGSNLMKDRKRGLVAGLLFSAHPIHTEAITWITASIDSYAHVFYLASFYTYVLSKQSQKQAKQRFQRVSLVFAGLAFFSNELSFSLPLLLLAYEYLIRKVSLTKIVTQHKNYWLILMGYFVVRFIVLDIQRHYNFLLGSLSSTVFIMSQALVKYGTLLLWPVNLTANHRLFDQVTSLYYFDNTLRFQSEFIQPVLTDPGVWGAILVLCGWGILILHLRRRKSFVSFCLTTMLASLIPVMQLVPTTTIFAERYLYIASVPFAWLSSWVLWTLAAKWGNQLTWFIAGGIICVYGFLTVKQNQVWRDDGSLWSHVLVQTPDSFMALTNLGSYEANQGNYASAASLFESAIELHPDNPKVRVNVARTYLQLNQTDLAHQQLEQAITHSQEDSLIRAIATEELQQLKQATSN